ncbi:MAG: ATP-binding cassette domain-containing protein, partial [Bradymonadaceae bacterium]
MSRSAVLTVDHVDKTFRVGFWRRRVEAVQDVSFSVRDGEIFGIVGPNGAGKTTTMKMMTNLIFPDAGEVRLFGEPTTRANSRRRLGYLPEEPYFYDHLSATEMLHYYGALHGLSRDAVDERIGDLLELVGLADVPDRPFHEFSK